MSRESYNNAIQLELIEPNMPFDIWEKMHRDIINIFHVPCMDGEHSILVVICTVLPIIKLHAEFGKGNPERYTLPAITRMLSTLANQLKEAVGCPFIGNQLNNDLDIVKSFDESVAEADAWFANWQRAKIISNSEELIKLGSNAKKEYILNIDIRPYILGVLNSHKDDLACEPDLIYHMICDYFKKTPYEVTIFKANISASIGIIDEDQIWNRYFVPLLMNDYFNVKVFSKGDK